MKIKKQLKQSFFKIKVECRKIGSEKRILPSFLIVGAQKAGTTSLFKYLLKHPHIDTPLKKEVHYFDMNYNKGINWYKSFFPFKSIIKGTDIAKITGEASPQYMFHPHSMERIKNNLPEIKIIILLRNPVYRSYSHYNHQTRVGRETLTFEEAIKHEKSRLEYELEKMISDEKYNSYPYLMYSYLSRSKYFYQIEKIFSYFNQDKILFIQSESLNRTPQIEYNKVLSFLDLPNCELDFSRKYNVRNYQGINEKTKQELEEYFKPYNEKLFELIGQRFDW